MLFASSKSGQRIDARKYEKKTADLFCPSCHQPVIFKKGRVKISHFAHYRHSLCDSFSEGETKEHLAAKILLDQWFPGGQLEAYLPALKQRPDLLVGKRAIEVQCSPLPSQRFMERNRNYLAQDYQPWWILGEKLSPRHRFGPIQKGATYLYKDQLYLWLIKPFKKELILLFDISWHYRWGMVYQTRKWTAFEEIDLNFLHTKNDIRWNPQEYRYFIYKKLGEKNARTLRLQEKLYYLHLSLQELPDECYQPSFYQFFFEDEQLFLDACFLKANNFQQWLQLIRQLDYHWQYPFVSQKEILWAVYRECQQVIKK